MSYNDRSFLSLHKESIFLKQRHIISHIKDITLENLKIDTAPLLYVTICVIHTAVCINSDSAKYKIYCHYILYKLKKIH